MTETLPALPHWLAELLPEKQPPVVLTKDGEMWILTYPDGTVESYASIEAAHNVMLKNDFDLYFDKRLTNDMLGSFFYKSSNSKDGYLTMLSSFTDETREKLLKRGYQNFLENAEAYRKDPTDFVSAWRFIDSHPAFWTAQELEAVPWHWEQAGYMSKVRQSVYREESGIEVILEAGSTVPQGKSPMSDAFTFNTHYADWRLEVVGTTFEDAVLFLASRVALCFRDDGSDVPKDEVDLEEPAWVTEVKERIAEADSQTVADN